MQKPEIPAYFCMLPFTSFAQTTDGGCRSCSYLPSAGMAESMEASWNSKHFVELRRQFLAGEKPPECDRCWRSEDAGEKSRRQQSLRWYKDLIPGILATQRTDGHLVDQSPVSYEVRLSNLCNFKCRSCDLRHSSRIEAESLQWGEFYREEYRGQNAPKQSADILKHIKAHISVVRQIRFLGGEPMLEKRVLEFLDDLQTLPARDDLELFFVSNLSHFPEQLQRALRRFPKSILVASLDAVGERGEYMRSGKKWKVFDQNLRKLREFSDCCRVVVNCAISVMNVHYLAEVMQYIKDVNGSQPYIELDFCEVTGPDYLDVRNLTQNVKKDILAEIERYESNYLDVVVKKTVWTRIKNYIASGTPNRELVQKGLRYMAQLDSIRREDFARVLPLSAQAMMDSEAELSKGSVRAEL